MSDLIADNFPYWATAILLVIGLYGMIGKHNLVKKIIGLNIFQSAIILFFISGSLRAGGTVPVILPGEGAPDPALYMNPLPQALMLTAIVVGAAITGVALAFLLAIHRRFGSMDERDVLQKLDAEH
ncbi:MAG: cation:proton antiporter subunit C [Chloroflexota bacterium]